jgi:uncharacterized membrane protein
MTENNDQLNLLIYKLEDLLKRQENFTREVKELREEINQLKISSLKGAAEKTEPAVLETINDTNILVKKEKIPDAYQSNQQPTTKAPLNIYSSRMDKPLQIKSDLEKFIGENLINKIGIAITVIGVAIGAKYAIDHQLISPLTRIILGYLVGLGLLGFAIQLKKKYENFSAVLLSGSMAIMYFITYAAYSFYDLIPQAIAFVLMVIFTAFTVLAAINYNRQVIAHIGLVGAYAVPFLLSEGSGKVAILFSYMAIINIGILVIAFKKYWKPLYYSSFLLTWAIYLLWYVSRYRVADHFGLALTFLPIFFVIFYLTILAYKLLKSEKYQITDILLLLANSFLFYGIGYSILSDHKTGEQLLGLFTLGNAIVHFIVSTIIYRQKLADRNLFYLVSSLVLVFITIAVPVQLDGNWVTLLWAVESALLFWIGRTKNVAIYEQLSYLIMILAFFSIVHDWTTVYDRYNPEQPGTRITPLLNINFLTSLIFIISFWFINILHFNKKYRSSLDSQKDLLIFAAYMMMAILLISLYYSFRMEIATFWNQLFIDSSISNKAENQSEIVFYSNLDLPKFKTVWLINYTALFLTGLSLINIIKLKSRELGLINLVLNTLFIATFLLLGLYTFSELRESYLEQTLSDYYHRGFFNIGIRYISFAFITLLLVVCAKYIRQDFMKGQFKIAFDILLHLSILWIVSSELINLMDLADSIQSYKLGISILWGVYSLLLIILGIWKKKQHLRIGAIILFAITLLKVFLYDIAYLDTISKTIIFVSLGVLLLVISFLYNKYRNIISNESEN